MENKSRRNNIRIDGTPESLEEADWEATEEKVKRKSVERLNLRECPKTERARRTGQENIEMVHFVSSREPSAAVCADSIKSFQVNSINHISHF